MKQIISFLLLIAAINKSMANTSIGNSKSILSGIITDAATKTPLHGASIFIHDIKAGAISNADGSYITPSFQNGRYLVEVSYQGYASIIETIEITGNTIKNFALNETVVEQDAVTVTGTTTATKIKNSPQPVSVISRTDLFKASSTNIIEALSKSVTGFTSLSTGPAIAKPVIRGLGYNRMVTINDGIRQEGQQWGDEHGIEIDEASVQKAEVLKGAASLMYGSDAMAGVLNIISNQPVQQGSIKANINSGYFSNNKMVSASANIAASFKNGINFNLYRSIKSATDYSNAYDGKVFNSRFNERNFGGYVGLNKHWGYTHLLFSSFNQKLGLIEGNRDAATGDFTVFAGTPLEHIATNDELNSRKLYTPYQHIHHFKIGIDNNIHFNKTRLTFNLAYQRNQRKEFGNPYANATPDLYFDLKTFTYNFQFHLQENKDWKTTIGINGMNQRNTNRADEVLIPAYKQYDIGGFIITKKAYQNFSITAGLRGDVRRLDAKGLTENGVLKFDALSKTFNNMSGSIGASYTAIKNITLKLNIARGFRAPNVSELCSNGAHEGTHRFEYGKQDLQSETSFQIDAGMEWNTEHVSFSVNTFYNKINHYIFYNKLSSASGDDSLVNVNGNLINAFQFNQSDAALYGFEANVDFHPHPLDWLHVQNSFSFVRGKFANNDFGSTNLPFMPAPKLLSEVKAEFKKLNNTFKNVYSRFELDNTFAQSNIFTSFNTETTTPAYTLLNFGFGGDIMLNKHQPLNIYFAINNIADIAYQSHLSRLKYTDVNNATQRMGVFNMGRNISIKINIPLSFDMK